MLERLKVKSKKDSFGGQAIILGWDDQGFPLQLRQYLRNYIERYSGDERDCRDQYG
ncbi:MAG: hypothetical protein JRJ65_01280 [Deltaproteobacteria bacterium]|nr:hypothetical protein [Deltaproteobacteria bacterium]